MKSTQVALSDSKKSALPHQVGVPWPWGGHKPIVVGQKMKHVKRGTIFTITGFDTSNPGDFRILGKRDLDHMSDVRMLPGNWEPIEKDPAQRDHSCEDYMRRMELAINPPGMSFDLADAQSESRFLRANMDSCGTIKVEGIMNDGSKKDLTASEINRRSELGKKGLLPWQKNVHVDCKRAAMFGINLHETAFSKGRKIGKNCISDLVDSLMLMNPILQSLKGDEKMKPKLNLAALDLEQLRDDCAEVGHCVLVELEGEKKTHRYVVVSKAVERKAKALDVFLTIPSEHGCFPIDSNKRNDISDIKQWVKEVLAAEWPDGETVTIDYKALV